MEEIAKGIEGTKGGDASSAPRPRPKSAAKQQRILDPNKSTHPHLPSDIC